MEALNLNEKRKFNCKNKENKTKIRKHNIKNKKINNYFECNNIENEKNRNNSVNKHFSTTSDENDSMIIVNSKSHSRSLTRSRKKEPIQPKNQRKSYSLEFKFKIVNEYLENNTISLRELASKYDISKSSINEWINSYDILKKEVNKRDRCKIEPGGRHASTEDIEGKLIYWIQKMRKLGIAINTANIIIKAINLFPDFNNKNYHSLLN